jgi:5-methylcytosine-specific restriction protein A
MKWQKKSKRYRQKHPRCAICGKPAKQVHHIKHRKFGGTDDDFNLISLCDECHTKLHQEETDGSFGVWILKRLIEEGHEPYDR